MKLLRKHCAIGAKEAEGVTVVIDVFRAFSCEPLFFYFGAKRVILEDNPGRALLLKQKNPNRILVGEINEVPIEGGDLGNSPSEVILKGRAFFENRTVIHRTTAGVTGATAALQKASEVILGSFVTAKAIARYIKENNPDVVTLVAMGDRAKKRAPEDEACADYLECLLTGNPYDPIEAFKKTVFQSTAQKFMTGEKTYLLKEDPIFCLQHDLFDFFPVAERVGNHIEAIKKS